MQNRIEIHYPIGGNSTLTWQTRQALSTSLFDLLWKRIIDLVTQRFIPTPLPNNEIDYGNWIYSLIITPGVWKEIAYVTQLIDDLLIFHPGATIQN